MRLADGIAARVPVHRQPRRQTPCANPLPGGDIARDRDEWGGACRPREIPSVGACRPHGSQEEIRLYLGTLTAEQVGAALSADGMRPETRIRRYVPAAGCVNGPSRMRFAKTSKPVGCNSSIGRSYSGPRLAIAL